MTWNDPELERLIEKLNSLKLYGCEDITIGDILRCPLIDFNAPWRSWKQGFRAIAGILRRACTVPWTLKVTHEPRTLFLCTFREKSRNHIRAFLNAAKLCDNRVEMLYSRFKFSPWGARYLKYPLIWNRQLKGIFPEFGMRMYVLDNIFWAFMDYEGFRHRAVKNRWDIHNLVVYCDLVLVENYFVQKFNLAGGTTVTMQHGTYSAISDGYTLSRSAYFLAESRYSANCAKKSGYTGIPIAAGSPHSLERDGSVKPAQFKTGTLGVFLDGGAGNPAIDGVNIAMIQILQDCCRRTNRKLLVKYHPDTPKGFYGQYIDSAITSEHGKEILAQEVGDKIDVAVISLSTVLTTMLQQWVPAILFQNKAQNDYTGWTLEADELKFSDEKGLETLLEWIETPDFYSKFDEYRGYFIPPGKTSDNYRQAYQRIGL